MSTASPRIPAVAAGPGTPAPPPGSTAWDWKHSSVSSSKATTSFSTRIPRSWGQFEITYRHRSATYRIVVTNPEGAEHGVRSVALDGHVIDGAGVRLADDGQTHDVVVVMG